MKSILVLGAKGMVGREVFTYLSTIKDLNVWGTTRNKQEVTGTILYCNVQSFEKDFKKIIRSTKKIDFIINCIGILSEQEPVTELVAVNAVFPHQLEKFLKSNPTKLIHISTDAVFSSNAGKVTEASEVSPDTLYGMSKKLGETTEKNALTVRTSLIGLDPLHHRGLLENVTKNKNTFPGFINQLWTGCTTLQFAQFCEYLVTKNNFSLLRGKTRVIHFAPLGPVSKYTIVKKFSETAMLSVIIIKTRGEKRHRILTSEFFDLFLRNHYTATIRKSLTDLLSFEHQHGKT